MSARREKRLRRLEGEVAYLARQVQSVLEELVRSQDILEKPVQFIYTPRCEEGQATTSFLERLLNRFEVWNFRRKYIKPDTTIEEAIEALKAHPPKHRLFK